MIALVTGGASCGKSAFAERLATALPGPRVYLATMQGAGPEAEARIARHRGLRSGKGFETLECPCCLEKLPFDDPSNQAIASDATVLLEDLGNLAANEMFSDGARTVDDVLAGIDEVACHCANLVIVTNELGSDGVSYDSGTRAYQEFLGALACACAQRADVVAEVVAGVPQIVKGTDAVATWIGGREEAMEAGGALC